MRLLNQFLQFSFNFCLNNSYFKHLFSRFDVFITGICLVKLHLKWIKIWFFLPRLSIFQLFYDISNAREINNIFTFQIRYEKKEHLKKVKKRFLKCVQWSETERELVPVVRRFFCCINVTFLRFTRVERLAWKLLMFLY